MFIIPKIEVVENKTPDSEIEDFVKLLLKNDISYNASVKIACKHFKTKKNVIYKKYMNLAKK